MGFIDNKIEGNNLNYRNINRCLRIVAFALILAIGVFCEVINNKENKVKAKQENAENTTDKGSLTNNIEVSAAYKVLNQKATVTVSAWSENGIKSIKYLKGEYKKVNHKNWKNKAKNITKKASFKTKKDGIYSILVEDNAGNKKICKVKVILEFRAVWIAYYDFEPEKYSDEVEFTEYVDEMFDNAASCGMNAVVVHVRPFSDAMYKSKYYPWSKYASGTQGEDPGFDPLEIMVKEAHVRGLELHAWLNPYRVTGSGTDVSVLAENNPARKWLTDDDTSNDRNVLTLGGKLYYNPSKKAVQKLIVNGIKEIVRNYNVDGIHFDDYFYPEYIGSDYETAFDGQEYAEYVEARTKAGKKVLSVDNWRRNNVNTLVKSIYSAVKEIDETVEFGISPGGYIDHLLKVDRNYVDFPTWVSNPGYIDYICPQLYWSFDKVWNTFPYDTTLLRWIDYRTDPSVKVYVGVGTYKCTSANTGSKSVDAAWKDKYILADMVDFARETGCVDGFIFFDYADMIRSVNKEQVDVLVAALEGSLIRVEEGEGDKEPEVEITEGDELVIEYVDKDGESVPDSLESGEDETTKEDSDEISPDDVAQDADVDLTEQIYG